MKYINFGKRKTPLSVIGYGTAGMKNNTSDLNKSLISCALDNGINLIDTAEQYGEGYSEKIVGESIEDVRDNIFIATKVSPYNLRYSDVISSLEESLRRLKTDHVDLYQIHVPNEDIPIEETMDALCHMVESGKVLDIGVSNFSINQLKSLVRLYPGKIVSVQRPYNILDREIDGDFRDFCNNNDISIMSYGTFDQGQIKNNLGKNAIEELCSKYKISLSQLCISFVISQYNSFALFNTTNLSHMKNNIHDSDFCLSASDIDYIKSVAEGEKVSIKPSQIDIYGHGRQTRKIYTTIEEAVNNIHDYCPSPMSISQSLKSDGCIFPVKVSKSTDKDRYNLIDGMIYFWGWIIAYGMDAKMEVYVRNK